MVFIFFCILVHWTKVGLALEGLIYHRGHNACVFHASLDHLGCQTVIIETSLAKYMLKNLSITYAAIFLNKNKHVTLFL